MSKKKTGLPKATSSFAQMMSQAQLNALKPFIQESVAQQSTSHFQQLAKLVLGHISQVQTRQIAIERLLKIDASILASTIADVEDESEGFTSCAEPAVAGNRVRIEVWSKKTADESYPVESDRILVNSLLKKSSAGTTQLPLALEEAIIGMVAGESRELVLPAEDGSQAAHLKFKLVKASQIGELNVVK